MKLIDLLNARSGIETLAKAKFSDGGLAYQAMKTLKSYNKEIEPYNELVDQARKEIQETQDEEAKNRLDSEWGKKLREATQEDAFFKASKEFTVAELIPEGNPHGFDAFALEALESIGVLKSA